MRYFFQVREGASIELVVKVAPLPPHSVPDSGASVIMLLEQITLNPFPKFSSYIHSSLPDYDSESQTLLPLDGR